jgi:hypothetical protein
MLGEASRFVGLKAGVRACKRIYVQLKFMNIKMKNQEKGHKASERLVFDSS